MLNLFPVSLGHQLAPGGCLRAPEEYDALRKKHSELQVAESSTLGRSLFLFNCWGPSVI